MCPGCYQPDSEGYCRKCRAVLFDGAKVTPFLSFEAPKGENLPVYQEKTKRLSISGVQLKYSLRREGQELVLTEKRGEYILKPVPPGGRMIDAEQAPENEHLTMQIAKQVFGIRTAANALIFFKDGTPAYITRRFDLRKDGSRSLQEDMAQLSGRSEPTHGEHFKYDGSYADIGALISQFAAAHLPTLEEFFRLVIFNYLVSNGDAHLKNFSLIQTPMLDYTLSPAYDLMNTVMHSPAESDTALDLYQGDLDSPFYSNHGFYGQSNFRGLAAKLGILPLRCKRILTQMLSQTDPVLFKVEQSFFPKEFKEKYRRSFLEKTKRMGKTESLIGHVLKPLILGADAVTEVPTRLTFLGGRTISGYFENTKNSAKLEADNQYTFIETHHAEEFRKTGREELITIVDGDLLTQVQYTGP